MIYLLCTDVLLLLSLQQSTEGTPKRLNTKITHKNNKYYVKRNGEVKKVDDKTGASDELYKLWRRIPQNEYESTFPYPSKTTLAAIDDLYNKRHSVLHLDHTFASGGFTKRSQPTLRGVLMAVWAGVRLPKLRNNLQTGAAGKHQSSDIPNNGIIQGKKIPDHVENSKWLESIRGDKVFFKVIRRQGHGYDTILLIHAQFEADGTEVKIEGDPHGLEMLIDAAIIDALRQQEDKSLKLHWIRQTRELKNDANNTKNVSDAKGAAHASQPVDTSQNQTKFIEGLGDSTTAVPKKALIINTLEIKFTDEAFVVMMKILNREIITSAGIRDTLTKGQDMFIINHD